MLIQASTEPAGELSSDVARRRYLQVGSARGHVGRTQYIHMELYALGMLPVEQQVPDKRT